MYRLKINKSCFITTLVVICMLSGCLSSTDTSSAPSETLVSVATIAEEISVDFGTVSNSSEGLEEKSMIIFEEEHPSRAAQIEIAIMLNRLYNNGMKVIALEGAPEGEVLNVQWFNKLSDAEAKKEVAVQLLKEGEISNAELIALCYPDVEVIGVEDPKEYGVEMTDDAAVSPIFYLISIAETSELSDDQINEAVELILQEKYEEYIEFIINADPWTRERYEMLNDENAMYSVEEMIQLSEEIGSKADNVGADIDDDTREDFQEFLFFWNTASQRSYTMTANALDACKRSPGAPIAFIIGAAHTAKISELLRDEYSAYAVIAPNSLNEGNDTSRLDLNAYERKCEGLSVDRDGMLGSLLDGRPKNPTNVLKKPPTVLDEPWFRGESQLRYGSELIARSAGEPGFPQEELEEELAKLEEYVKIDPASITIDDDDDSVVFPAIVFGDDEPVTIYCRVSLVKDEDELNLEADNLENLLKDVLSDVKATSHSEDIGAETEARPTLMEITPGRIAIVSKDSSAVRNIKLNAA